MQWFYQYSDKPITDTNPNITSTFKVSNFSINENEHFLNTNGYQQSSKGNYNHKKWQY